MCAHRAEADEMCRIVCEYDGEWAIFNGEAVQSGDLNIDDEPLLEESWIDTGRNADLVI